VQEIESPERIAVSPAGDTAAFVVPKRSDGKPEATGVWIGPLDGIPRRISDAVPATGLAFSPDGGLLAFAVHDEDASRVEILAVAGEAADSTRLEGFAEALSWTAEGLLVLAAEPGADSASLHSGRPLAGAGADPQVFAEPAGWRRIWRIDPGRDARPVTPAGPTVWEFAAIPAGIVAVCSDDPSEDGWYKPYLALLAGDSVTVLHRSDWMLSAPTVDPVGQHVAFIEGWASDRGLLAGEIRVLPLRGGEPRSLDCGADATWLGWDRDGRLWFAGWDHLGTAWGCFENVDAPPAVHRDAAALFNSRWHPAVAPLPDGDALSVRSTPEQPPEVTRLSPAGQSRSWSALNHDVTARPVSVRELRWAGAGGLEIEGVLVLPADREGPPPLVVDIHGGPSLAWPTGWTMTWAEVLAAAGFAVLLPNYRGSVGRGRGFGQLNLGDPGGAELEDIIAGVRHCAASGLTSGSPAGAIGASYGGYLSAWAACRPDVFGATVVIAGVTDLLSCRGTANNGRFYHFLLQAPLSTHAGAYLERSPVAAITAESAPTLILHGEQDRCVPVGQAHELHYALRNAGVATELVVYPREGHQSHEPAHIEDQRRRAVDWLSRYLR
jgi:dipeptidyl aminopeptidase/acylaminoacyl peptidase